MKVSGQLHVVAALASRKESQVFFVQEAGFCAEEKICNPCWKYNPESSVVRSVDRHYNSWAIPDPNIVYIELLKLDLYIEYFSAEVKKDRFVSTSSMRLLGAILYRCEPLNFTL
jgi:hypothetical protein